MSYGATRGALKRLLPIFAILLSLLARPAMAEPPEVVMLGDSLTQGYGLPDGEGLVPQLQTWLHIKGVEAKLINMGVSGDTTAGGLSRVAWSLSPETKAVVVALGGNDLLRGLSPAETRANLEAIVEEIEGRGIPILLLGLPAPANYGPDWVAQFNAIFPDLASKYDLMMDPDQLAPLSALTPAQRDAQGLMQADNIHPSAAGVALEVEHIGPLVKALLAQATGG